MVNQLMNRKTTVPEFAFTAVTAHVAARGSQPILLHSVAGLNKVQNADSYRGSPAVCRGLTQTSQVFASVLLPATYYVLYCARPTLLFWRGPALAAARFRRAGLGRIAESQNRRTDKRPKPPCAEKLLGSAAREECVL